MIPAVGAVAKTFYFRNQSVVRENDLCPALLFGDLEAIGGTGPFGLVIEKVQPAICDQPDNPFVGDYLDEFVSGIMYVAKKPNFELVV